MKKYYKILTPTLESICVNSPNVKLKPLVVQYNMNQWTYPNPGFEDSDLMVFDDLKKVYHFIINNDIKEFVICECQAKHPKKYGIFLIFVNLEGLKDILRLKKCNKRFLDKCAFPPSGTIFCSAVKLTKIIFCNQMEVQTDA